jgi:hypothetical protein
MELNKPDNGVKNIDYSNAKILQSIQELQQLEKQLYTNLVNSSANPSDNNMAEQHQIIKRINELSSTRIQLFGSLRNLYKNSQDNVNNLRTDLADKMIVAKVMEEQLNVLKNNMNSNNDEKNNKLRMVEINTYFGKRYQAHTSVMKLVIVICLLLLFISILTKRGFVPSNISNVLIIIILVIGSILILRRIADLSLRDNMNYDEYNWDFHPEGINLDSNLEGGGIDLDFDSNVDLNFWSICGEGTIYDESKNQCIVKLPELGDSVKSSDYKANKVSPSSDKENFRKINLNNIQGL